MYIAQTPYHITHNALKPQKLIKLPDNSKMIGGNVPPQIFDKRVHMHSAVLTGGLRTTHGSRD